MANNLSQYFGRYGVITEEQDFSVITTPDAETLSTLVIGFSRKGKFNTPLLIGNSSRQEKLIGLEDRNLERKGSFMHRTVSKLLPYAPVYVMNLLATDDTLDKLEYISMSSATEYGNDVIKDAPYRTYHDSTGFWERKTDNFINITRPNDTFSHNLINFTNFSDKYITMFIFKSSVNGFDYDFKTWFGTSNDMPEFVSDLDYVSDYMVDVLVVAGDYTNYHQLAVDTRWGQYFTNSGLRKDRIRNFANDVNVGTLGYYTGLSMIPNFRDKNGRNIYIETVINNDTDTTGLYCAVNEDLLYTDYRNGYIDLIGHGLVGNNTKEVNFLSYQDTIVESLGFYKKEIDSVGNVIGIKTPNGTLSGRTDLNMNWNISGVSVATPVLNGNNDEITYTLNTATGAYFISDGVKVSVVNETFTVDATTLTDGTYVVYFSINNNGTISMHRIIQGGSTTFLNNLNVLYYSTIVVAANEITSNTTTYILVNGTGYVTLAHNTDYTITPVSEGKFKVDFLQVSNSNIADTLKTERNKKTFAQIIDALTSANKYKMALLTSASGIKHSMSDMVISDVINTTNPSTPKSFVIDTKLTNAEISSIINDKMLVFYVSDNEFILGANGATTTNNVGSVSAMGVVGKYSDFYQRYYTGSVNNGDYFEKNIVDTSVGNVDVEFDDLNNRIIITGSLNYALSATDTIFIRSEEQNPNVNKKFTITSVISTVSPYTYEVDEVVLNSGDLFNVDNITNGDIVKLSIWMENNEILNIQYTDDAGNVIPTLANIEDNENIILISGKSNFKESLDVVYPTGYVRVPNKILVNASRYVSLMAGDFLESNWSVSEEYPEETPRKLTRILKKIVYAPDTQYVEITCDSEIKVSSNNQATKYSTIENYVNTYKGTKLKGFRVRKECMPDGTEQRQKEILRIIENGSPLFKSITNRDAISFRYLVDSFGLGLTENSKQELVDICGERLDCFGILSAPSMKQFKNSSSPSFVNEEYVLQTEYIAKGGNPQSNPAFVYSLATGKGVTSVGYFAPYIDMGNILVPPAMFVAETYLQKLTSTNSRKRPWTICAGSTDGKVNNVPNLEMIFNPDDVYWLSEAKINPIVYKKTKGYLIETEFTAQTLFISSLSYIHSREVLIELEGELRSMLLDYQWKFNTVFNRSEIKLKADVICDRYVAAEGLTKFFNKCDGENNTNDMIDMQLGKLDTAVEIVKGMGLIINNVQVYRSGGIESSGFA